MSGNKSKRKMILLLVSLVLTAIAMRLLSPENKLDSRFYYSAIQAEKFFRGLSSVAVSRYIWCEILDLWFLINYSMILFILYANSVFKRWRYFSIITGALDLLETSLILINLISGTLGLGLLALTTTAKWVSGLIILMILAHGLIRKRQLKV